MVGFVMHACVCECLLIRCPLLSWFYGFSCFLKSKQSCAYDSRLEISLPLVEVMLEVLPWLKMADQVAGHSSVYALPQALSHK